MNNNTTTPDRSLPPGDFAEVIDEVNRLRAELGPRAEFTRPEFLESLVGRLADTPALAERPLVAAFIEDIRGYADDPRLTRTKALINNGTENSIFGLFNASYFPSLTLEYLHYRTLPTDARLIDRYPSPTMPVVVEGKTTGFDSRTVVALFPENQIDARQEPDDLIFYFIDKFVTRHTQVTRLLIGELMEPDAFGLIRTATIPMVESASSWWVRLHEYHHRQGDMPIPEYLPAKSSKPLAGLEELRTDVSSMLACRNDDQLPRDMADLTYQFILAERLLRYAVEGIPRPNYDAVASQLLFNYLNQAGAITVADGRIHLGDHLPETLQAFLDEIHRIEARIHEHDVEHVRDELRQFANGYTDYDHTAGDYRHIPFFADAKQRLGI